VDYERLGTEKVFLTPEPRAALQHYRRGGKGRKYDSREDPGTLYATIADFFDLFNKD
jgi:hypothetical protein